MKILMVGDLLRDTGYGLVNQTLARHWLARGHELAGLALGYDGTPHALQSSMALYPAPDDTDPLGLRRLAMVVERERPHVIFHAATPWIASRALDALAPLGPGAPPYVPYLAIDGPELNPAYVTRLNRAAHAIPYTRSGERELLRAGYTGLSTAIPHGVDHDTFYPEDKAEARAMLGLHPEQQVILWLDRNQPRKRLDLAMRTFKIIAESNARAMLLLHTSAKDVGWDINHEANKLGIASRVVLTSEQITPERGMEQSALRMIYSTADVKLSTTQGEGWGLTTMEAMACGVPNIVPNWSGLAEWAAPAAILVPINDTIAETRGVGTEGGIIAPEVVAQITLVMLGHPEGLADIRAKGLRLVNQDCYQWPVIAAQIAGILEGVALE